MSKIIFDQGYDWSKEDVVFVSNAGVERSNADLHHLSEKHIRVYQTYDNLLNDFVDCGDFLVVKSYYLEFHPWQVKDMKAALDQGQDHFTTVAYQSNKDNRYRYFQISHETRIYKDRSYIRVLKFEVFIPESKPVVKYYVYNKSLECSHLYYIITLKDILEDTLDKDVYIRVKSEEDINAAPRRNIYKSKGRGGWGPSRAPACIGLRNLYYHNAYQCDAFDENTQNTINKFFDIGNNDNSKLLSYSFHKALGYRTDYDRGIMKINNPYLFNMFMKIPSIDDITHTNSAQAKKNKTMQDYWKELHFPKSTQKYVGLWERHGDEFISLSFNHGNGCKNALIFNLKNHKKYIIIKTPSGVFEYPAASTANIIKKFPLIIEKSDYYIKDFNKFRCDYKCTIYDGKTIKELFAGTKIEWILDNIPRDAMVPNFGYIGNGNYTYNGYSVEPNTIYENKENQHIPEKLNLVRSFIDQISELQMLPIMLLSVDNDPWMEQTLKLKLFNLFFAGLWDKSFSTSYYTRKTFCDLGAKFTNKELSENPRICFDTATQYSVTYNSKLKSIKKMMGMSMNQIKVLNDSIQFFCPTIDRWNNKTLKYIQCPNIAFIPFYLSTHHTFSEIGDQLFKELITKNRELLCKDRTYAQFDPSRFNLNTWDGLCQGRKIKDNMDFLLYLYQLENANIYTDYLRFRVQMKEIQTLKPEIQIFSEDKYPIRIPDKTYTKVVMFHSGMRIGYTTVYRPNDFLSTLNREYYDRYYGYEDNKDIVAIKDAYNDNAIIGAELTFNGEQYLHYLHDELSYWISFYQTAAKQELFTEAVKRVLPLEWTDGTLSIVAPRKPHDLENESSVLSHCVRSFIDPIINNTENVLFIRKNERIDEPFFTLALDNNGCIEQVHCFGNGDLSVEGQQQAYQRTQERGMPLEVYKETVDVVGFLKRWAKAMNGKISRSSINSRYGALCAKH